MTSPLNWGIKSERRKEAQRRCSTAPVTACPCAVSPWPRSVNHHPTHIWVSPPARAATSGAAGADHRMGKWGQKGLHGGEGVYRDACLTCAQQCGGFGKEIQCTHGERGACTAFEWCLLCFPASRPRSYPSRAAWGCLRLQIPLPKPGAG